MEFLSKIADYTIEPVVRLLGRQAGYVIHCKTNLQNLQAKVDELKAARQAVENKIAEAERKGEDIQPDVQLWLTKVGQITARTDELLNDEGQAQLKCFHGFCPNLTVRHQLSRKSTKLVQEVVEHHEKRGLISQVSCGILRKEVWSVTTGDYQAFQSRMSIVKEIMDSLKDSDIHRMGVCGIGGVGKTTLVKEVYKQASEDKELFDNVVILLDVKSNPDPEAIQKKIVEKLGMELLQTETIEGRASRLCAKIQGKKILIILDDVQEKIELEDMGVPRLPTCKILLTCRTREVLSLDMQANKVFQLDLLGKEETWSLFTRMAGDVVEQNGRVRDVAIQIAQKCGGLPLLVVTVASALKEKKKLQAWKDALRRLKNFDKEESTKKAYLALEWSYDQLDDKELKPIFLLCGMIVMRNDICLQDMLKYGMGLGLFKNISTVEEAQDSMDTFIEKLKDSCLLLDGETEGWVRMHDLVCDVAKWIARRDQYILSVEYRGELKEWPGKDFLKKCTKIFLPSSNIPTLPEIPLECPKLELFHLNSKDDSVVIPSNFFNEMQKLKVLDLTNMCMPSLPLSLQYLKTLQTLCLDLCTLGDITLLGQLSSLEILSLLKSDVEELPREIGQLTRLRLLDLSECSQLEVIAPTVISSLVKLEDLRMRNSFNKWEIEGEKGNASLSELKHLLQLSALEIHIPNADFLPANLFSHKLERYNIVIGDAWVKRHFWEKPMARTSLNTLKLKLTNNNIMGLDEGLKWLLKRSEDLSLDESVINIVQQMDTKDFENVKRLRLQNNIDFTYIINRKVVFPYLVTLEVHGCDNSRFLFSFSMAKSFILLKHLKISTCELLQEVVSSTRACGEENMDEMFSKLNTLELEALPNLARFGTGNYIEFLALEELKIDNCVKLVEFIGDKVATSSKDTRNCQEIEQRVLEEEENLDVKREIGVQYILFDKKVVFPNLVTLTVHGCDNLRFLFSFSMARSLVLLEDLKISSCEFLQEIVSSTRKCGEENMDDMFSKLNILELEALPNLARFGIANYIEFPALEELEIKDCVELVEFIGAKVATSSKDTRICTEIEQRVLEQEENLDVNSKTVVQYILFDKKVGFPSLERLSIDGARELKAIWHVQLARDSFRRLKQVDVQECNNLISLFPPSVMGRLNALETLKIWCCGSLEVIFELRGRSNVKEIQVDTSFPHDQLEHFDCQNLDSINIYKCHSLKQIFPASVARGLQNLTQLDVDKCDAIEEIVGEEEEKEGLETIPPHFVFPKVTSVKLKNLPQLTSFYPKTHASQCPLLVQLKVVRCDKVGIFAAEFSFSQKKPEMNHLMSQSPFFSINEDSFLYLEDLELSDMEIWNGPTPENPLVFGKLKSITFRGSRAPFSKQASVIFLQRLQNLEEIEIDNCSWEAIFVNQGISTGEEKHDDGVRSGGLPRVRILSLESMDELMHLGNDNSQSLLFPNLETLKVSLCTRLRSLESYAIFFRNLTTLTIFACDGLGYLTSYSVAKSLVQLTTLEVIRCDRIVVIVSSNGDDDADAAGNEIAFSRLQHLELTGLPSLQGFCSGNCTLKFPSSITLEVEDCPIKLKISPEGVLVTEIDHQFQQNRVDYDSDDDEEEDVEKAERNPEILSEGPAS
ncbi:probable disease resistance protein At4g27220 isoform X1 [Rosa rugosa]|uniref:probable disease resistance protein At4g27220 isoform X1 n=1 Tax=Rosa rugosa TaxID=74645 RepID=UPI002B40D663|nr:probable disease resistance protein At4g27220 isoform X1 [Rosa rugosa]XP_062012604.1 probable disease resistance protein At4g27220 isoform X1 [Rosa rugosa]XP_062012605.1 probable disease resistance protein At4g27220 isoform X1 [Rosa rugosa]